MNENNNDNEENNNESNNDNDNDPILAPFIKRRDYLTLLVNSLVIQNLACGNIPKIKAGVPMQVESLIKLKEELDFKISQTLKHEPSQDISEKQLP